MSKKNKKKSAKKIEKVEFNNKEDIIIWRKIIIFSIIFFPYALYLFLFKTNISKYIKAVVVVFLSILMFFVVDTVKNPNRVYNEIAFEEINKFSKANADLNIGEVHTLDKVDNFMYKENEYIVFNLTDDNSMYYGIFKIEKYNKKYEMSFLYKLETKESILYDKGEFDKFKNIHPIVFVELLSNSDFEQIDKILNVDKVKEDDMFFNDKYQTIKTSNDEITFKFNEFGIIEYKSKNLNKKYNVNPLKALNFKAVDTVLYNNFKDDYKIVGYNYYNGTHAFNVIVGDTKYIVEYYIGHGASLQSVENEAKYMKFLKEIYEK